MFKHTIDLQRVHRMIIPVVNSPSTTSNSRRLHHRTSDGKHVTLLAKKIEGKGSHEVNFNLLFSIVCYGFLVAYVLKEKRNMTYFDRRENVAEFERCNTGTNKPPQRGFVFRRPATRTTEKER